jgi:hypothetical protein
MRRLADMTEPELREYFNMLATVVEDVLPAGPSNRGRALFTLLVFDESLIGQYVSNCQRAEMIKVLRETADRIEGREDIPR